MQAALIAGKNPADTSDVRELLRQILFRYLTRVLTKPLGNYVPAAENDVGELRRHIRKGDVLLVCGEQRVSEIIKYLTQSSWSHAAIYVGDAPLRRFPEQRASFERRFGDDASHLLVEALIDEGVVISPLSKYVSFHLRLCRPCSLSDEDCERVVEEILGQLNYRYDLRNLFDLARYFLPISLLPRRNRLSELEFGSGKTTEVICSTVIARAFSSVAFPILPAEENGSWPSRRPLARHLRMRERPLGLITPRDFDLSPYFEVIKFNFIEGWKQAATSLERQYFRARQS
jgi:hypothetical protein